MASTLLWWPSEPMTISLLSPRNRTYHCESLLDRNTTTRISVSLRHLAEGADGVGATDRPLRGRRLEHEEPEVGIVGLGFRDEEQGRKEDLAGRDASVG